MTDQELREELHSILQYFAYGNGLGHEEQIISLVQEYAKNMAVEELEKIKFTNDEVWRTNNLSGMEWNNRLSQAIARLKEEK